MRSLKDTESRWDSCQLSSRNITHSNIIILIDIVRGIVGIRNTIADPKPKYTKQISVLKIQISSV